MHKFEHYLDMDKVNMTEVKEFIFKGDTYKLIPHTPPPNNAVDKMLNSITDEKVAQELREFIEEDNARFTGTEMAFHCYEKETTLYIYWEKGIVRDFWWGNELALAD